MTKMDTADSINVIIVRARNLQKRTKKESACKLHEAEMLLVDAFFIEMDDTTYLRGK